MRRIINHDWWRLKGWRVRLNSVIRCLTKKHFVLVAWVREDDGEITFLITHKGVEIPEAIHRLKVDAADILEDVKDQMNALDAANDIIK